MALTDPYGSPPDSEPPPRSEQPTAVEARGPVESEPEVPRGSQFTSAPDLIRVSYASDPGLRPSEPAVRASEPSAVSDAAAQIPTSRYAGWIPTPSKSAPGVGGAGGVGPPPSPPREPPIGPIRRPSALEERPALKPPKPAAPLNRSLRLRVAGLAFGALALGGALVGGLWLWDQRSIPMFPNGELGSLPEGTAYVRRIRANKPFVFGEVSVDDEFEEARWSWLGSAMCGGEDVFSALVDAKGKYAVPRAAKVLDHWRNNAKAIACGRALAKKLGRGSYYVRFSTERPEEKHGDLREERKDRKRPVRELDGDEPRKEERPRRPRLSDVLLLDLDVSQLPPAPPSFIPWLETGGLSDVHCVSSSPRLDSDCKPSSKAAARLEGTSLWVSGELSDIEQFGRRFSPAGKNDLDNEEDFKALEEKVKSFPSADIGSWETFEPSSVLWRAGFTDIGMQRGISHAALERSVYKYRASWAITERQVDGLDELQLVLVTGSELDSKELALDLKEWHTNIKEAILDAMEKEPMGIEDEELKRLDREFNAARRKIGTRTVRRAIVEREEKFVFLTFLREVDDDEAEAEQDWREDMKDRGATAAKIIRAMLDGERPDMDLVRELGGRSLVEALEDGGTSSREEKERARPTPVE